MRTLWVWSKTKDEWEFGTECNGGVDFEKRVLRNQRRRHPKATQFRWTDGPPPERKYRQRALKERV